MAACVDARLSWNLCNEIMKREIDFTPRTAERSIMVDWLRIRGSRPRPWSSVPLPVFPYHSVLPGASSRPKWKTIDSSLRGELSAHVKREKWSSKSREGEQILRDGCAMDGGEEEE